MPGGIATAKAIRHKYQTGQLKAKDGSWYARFYDEVPDGNGALRSKERWKKLGRIEDYPRERDIFPVFEGFMQAVNDRLMGAAGPDPSLRVFIEQKYLPSLRLEKKTVRGYTDTWNLHWKSRIRDLTFSQLHPDVAFRIIKEIAEQDDLSKASLQRVKAFMSGVYTYAREGGHFRGANPLTGLRLQKIKARRARKMPFNSLSDTLAYIETVDGLRAKAAVATAAFAGLTVSELQGLDWKDRYDGQWHVERKVVEGRTGATKTEARQEGVPNHTVFEDNNGRILGGPRVPHRGLGFRQVDEQLKARSHYTRAKEEGNGMVGMHSAGGWQPTCTTWEFLLK